MEQEGLNHDERVGLFDAIYRIVGQLEKRLDAEIKRTDDLRAADLLARSVAYEGVRERMEGFPQQYATKTEQDAIKDTASRLEKDSISREIYDTNHNALRLDVSRKLDAQVFDATLAEWTTWRRQVEQRLAASQGVQTGISRTFYWAVAGVGAVAAAVAIIISFN